MLRFTNTLLLVLIILRAFNKVDLPWWGLIIGAAGYLLIDIVDSFKGE